MGYDAGLLYPDRKRCARCRRYFGFEVIAGLWCSRECADFRAPSDNPEDWPRQHYTFHIHTRIRKPKRDFLYLSAAIGAAKKYGKEAYRCDYCLGYHIGSSPKTPLIPTETR